MPKKKKNAEAWNGAVEASAAAAAPDAPPVHQPVLRKTYKQKLPCRIEDLEVADKADQLAKVIQEREAVRLARREANAAFREKLAFFDERLTDLAGEVAMHTAIRDVECKEYLIVETNEVQTFRTDTGEIIGRHTAEAADRQEALDLPIAEDENGELVEDPDHDTTPPPRAACDGCGIVGSHRPDCLLGVDEPGADDVGNPAGVLAGDPEWTDGPNPAPVTHG